MRHQEAILDFKGFLMFAVIIKMNIATEIKKANTANCEVIFRHPFRNMRDALFLTIWKTSIGRIRNVQNLSLLTLETLQMDLASFFLAFQ